MPQRIFSVMTTGLIGAVMAWPTLAQEQPSREQIARRILERNPEADTNKDGQLSQEEFRAFRESRGQERPRQGAQRQRTTAPTHADLAYGPNERHRLDLFIAPAASAEDPTPLVVFIHGGGFVNGGKEQVSDRLIQAMHDAGISVAAINYRFVTTDPLPAAMHDGARAIQFLRAHAAEYHLDASRFAATGGSAGAGISLWLAMHDDLADADSDDPIARQSTRLTCATVNGAQVSYDPRFWTELGLMRSVAHRSFPEMYGYPDGTDDNDPGLVARMAQSAPITFLTHDDPPMRLDYGVPNEVTDTTAMNALIHHPRQGLALQKSCQPIGVTCEVYYPGGTRPEATSLAFLIEHLKSQ